MGTKSPQFFPHNQIWLNYIPQKRIDVFKYSNGAIKVVSKCAKIRHDGTSTFSNFIMLWTWTFHPLFDDKLQVTDCKYFIAVLRSDLLCGGFNIRLKNSYFSCYSI